MRHLLDARDGWVVMYLACLGKLQSMIIYNKFLEEKESPGLLCELAAAVDHFLACGVFHRDVKQVRYI